WTRLVLNDVQRRASHLALRVVDGELVAHREGAGSWSNLRCARQLRRSVFALSARAGQARDVALGAAVSRHLRDRESLSADRALAFDLVDLPAAPLDEVVI